MANRSYEALFANHAYGRVVQFMARPRYHARRVVRGHFPSTRGRRLRAKRHGIFPGIRLLTVLLPEPHQIDALKEQLIASVSRTSLIVTDVIEASSLAISLPSVHTIDQSLKLDRRPCGTASIFMRFITCRSVASLSGGRALFLPAGRPGSDAQFLQAVAWDVASEAKGSSD